MTHVIVKLDSGQSEQQKQRLADAIAKEVMDILQFGEKSVSVQFEEAVSQNWTEQIYQPGMQEEWNGIYKKPGYEPF